MSRIKINQKIVLDYDCTYRNKYWGELSSFIINKYGKKTYSDPQKVEDILVDSFNFLCDRFKEKVFEENKHTFFLYTHWLHEQSIKIYIEILKGLKLEGISDEYFAVYRRILKLILEQGCDIDLEWGNIESGKFVLEMDKKIEDLIYLGIRMYHLADNIAYQKMIGDGCQVSFDNKSMLNVEWKYNYNEVYKHFFPMLIEGYKKATFDENAVLELRKKIEECFKIDYDIAGGLISEIQKRENFKSPELVTIEPEILPLNLVNLCGIKKDIADTFYQGLTISRKNKLSIKDAILKPYSDKRLMYRPILVYTIGGKERALFGENKFVESIITLAINAMSWDTMLTEWLKITGIKSFIDTKKSEHDKILEEKIEDIVKKNKFLYCRYIKSFKQTKNNIRIDNSQIGEIDLIVINSSLKKIFVGEVKYNKARYEAVGYRLDYSNFIGEYEAKLERKTIWIDRNKNILEGHLKTTFNKTELDLKDYTVEGIFIINTPTFYMLNGKYKAITLKQFDNFINGKDEYPNIIIVDDKGMSKTIAHPYFRSNKL